MHLFILLEVCLLLSQSTSKPAPPHYVIECVGQNYWFDLKNIGGVTPSVRDHDTEVYRSLESTDPCLNGTEEMEWLYCIDCKGDLSKNFCIYKSTAGYCLQVVCRSIVPNCGPPRVPEPLSFPHKDHRTRAWTEYSCGESYPRSTTTARTTGANQKAIARIETSLSEILSTVKNISKAVQQPKAEKVADGKKGRGDVHININY